MASDPFDDDFRLFNEATADESDRGLVLMSGDQVSEALRKLLLVVLVDHQEDKGHFVRQAVNGFLRDFAKRASAAYLFGLLHRATFLHIEALRGLRNAVAHSRTAFDLGAPPLDVQRHIDGLVPFGGIVELPDDLGYRNRFRVWATAWVTCFWIDAERQAFEDSGRLDPGCLSQVVTDARALALVGRQRGQRAADVAKRILKHLGPELPGGDVPPDGGDAT